jgi:gluconolactonase
MTSNASPSAVATGLKFPEGPVAMADGSVLVVEIGSGLLRRVGSGETVDTVADIGGGPNGAAIGPDGHCYICNNGGFRWQVLPNGDTHPIGRAANYAGGRIERVNLATGSVERVFDSVGGKPLSGPNDIVFDAHGGFWFTDLGHMGEHSIERGRICYARYDGSVREMGFPLLTPNGIGLSPDGRMLYVAETVTARLWAFDVVAPGELALQAMPPAISPGRLLYVSPHMVMFDSLAVEADGNVCVATIGVAGQTTPGGAGITVISPDGMVVDFVPMPDRATTNICFGGPGLRTAWVTQSRQGRLLRMDWPRAGLALHGAA